MKLLAAVLATLELGRAADPLAPHQLVVVPAGGDAVIRLAGFDLDGDELSATVASLPGGGSLKQLSAVFSDYGYEPKSGADIGAGAIAVTGSANRVVYERPELDRAEAGKWGTFTYTVSDAFSTSAPGIVTLVPESGVLVASTFFLDSEAWSVVGNAGTSAAASALSYDGTSRGALLNRYVHATDATVNVDAAGNDRTKWYFAAPTAFLGHHGIAYGGALEFVLASFSGDFAEANRNEGLHLVELECAACDTNAGVTLAFPLAASAAGAAFDGAPTQFSLPLLEGGGWVKDPKNTLQAWVAPSQGELVEVLSGLSAVRILGDFTKWYEAVALDSVQFVQRSGMSQIPICAQGSPDASVRTC